METVIQFWDESKKEYVEVSADNPLPISVEELDISTSNIEDGAVTTPKLAGGSVTDDKLANPKVNKAGDTMTGPLHIADPNHRSKIVLTMYDDGNYSGHQNAPTNLDIGSIYLYLGGTEYGLNSYRLVGAGFRQSDSNHAPVVFGYQEVSKSGHTSGDFIIGTRNSTSDVAPSIHFRIRANGQIELENSNYTPGSDKSVTNKKYVDNGLAQKLTATQATAQADSTATDIAGLVADFNSLLDKLRTAGIIAT